MVAAIFAVWAILAALFVAVARLGDHPAGKPPIRLASDWRQPKFHLEKSSLREWSRASHHDKVATAADWINRASWKASGVRSETEEIELFRQSVVLVTTIDGYISDHGSDVGMNSKTRAVAFLAILGNRTFAPPSEDSPKLRLE